MRKILVTGAHLDDAILSAGQFIAGRGGNIDILTIFSGIPMKENLLTEYDKKNGFTTSKDAMVVRRQEDVEACAILNANPHHTDILDSQYDKRQRGITKLLSKAVKADKYEMIVGPLGLIHPDHIAVSESLTKLGLRNLYLYEDLPARVTHPELVAERLKKFTKAELTFIGDGPIADKVRALWAYKSQVGRGDLNPYNLYVPERFYHVTP